MDAIKNAPIQTGLNQGMMEGLRQHHTVQSLPRNILSHYPRNYKRHKKIKVRFVRPESDWALLLRGILGVALGFVIVLIALYGVYRFGIVSDKIVDWFLEVM